MQAILTRFLCPTNSRDARISAQCAAGRVVVPYAHELNCEENHRAAAQALQGKLGWSEDHYGKLVTGQLPNGDYCHVFTGR